MYSQCIALIRFCLLLPFGVSTDTPEKCMKPMTKLDLGANLDKGQLQSNPKQITTVHHTSDCSNGRFFAFDTHRGEPFCCFHASKSVQWISMYTLTKVETWYTLILWFNLDCFSNWRPLPGGASTITSIQAFHWTKYLHHPEGAWKWTT